MDSVDGVSLNRIHCNILDEKVILTKEDANVEEKDSMNSLIFKNRINCNLL